MEDIAPALLETLQKAFCSNLAADANGVELLAKIANGGTYADAGAYAEVVGAALTAAFREHLSSAVLPDGRMYWNIADRVVRPLLGEDHDIVASVAVKIQQKLNSGAGIGIKAQKHSLNIDRVNGILNRLAEAENYSDIAWILDDTVITFSRSVVDETLQLNAEFQSRAGLRPKIIRQSEHLCCEFCSKWEGVYTYPGVPKQVYQRHANCRCIVEYDPGEGRRKDVHTKQWTDDSVNDKIKYAPSIQRRESKVKTSPKKYNQLVSIFNTLHPGSVPGGGPITIRDSSYGYRVEPDGDGGIIIHRRWKL